MAAPPRITIAKPNRPNGVLSVPVSTTQKKTTNAPFRQPSQPLARLKLVVRRLPPGLTREEFEEVLGDEWKVGANRLSWVAYREGKVSKEWVKSPVPGEHNERLNAGLQPGETVSTLQSLRSLNQAGVYYCAVGQGEGDKFS